MFLVPTSGLIHDFWTVQGFRARAAEQIDLLKNPAPTGAALAPMYDITDRPLSLGQEGAGDVIGV